MYACMSINSGALYVPHAEEFIPFVIVIVLYISLSIYQHHFASEISFHRLLFSHELYLSTWHIYGDALYAMDHHEIQ